MKENINYISVYPTGKDVSYVDYGTKGYLRTNVGEIRACKCVGVRWSRMGINYTFVQETLWKVAGLEDIKVATRNSRIADLGIVYSSAEHAQFGSSWAACGDKQMGEIEPNKSVNVYGYLKDKYNFADHCLGAFFHNNTRSDTIFAVHVYKPEPNHTIGFHYAEMELYVDSHGFHFNIPDIESGVGFTTEKQAKASMSPLKVIDFEDECVEKVEMPLVTLKVTLEVGNIEKLMEVVKRIEDI